MSVLSPTRSGVLATAAAAGALSALPAGTAEADEDNAIRPFSISFPEDALFDLGRRIAATRWPERETVTDDSQGVQRATIQQLAHYHRVHRSPEIHNAGDQNVR